MHRKVCWNEVYLLGEDQTMPGWSLYRQNFCEKEKTNSLMQDTRVSRHVNANTWLKARAVCEQISKNVEEERSPVPLPCCRSGLYSREQTSAELWHPLIVELRGWPGNCSDIRSAATQRNICPTRAVCVDVQKHHLGESDFHRHLSATDLQISVYRVVTHY